MKYKRSKSNPSGKLVWLGWSMVMLLLLFFSIDRIMEFKVLSFEVFVGIILFFIIILQMVVLGWVLYLRNRAIESDEKLTNAIKKLEGHLEEATII